MAGQGTAALRRPTIAGLRILLVEDEAMLGLLFSVMIESLGHVVCGVATTETGAVQAAADLNPDLMIVDVGLGRGDGVAAMAQILALRRTPHMFISGNIAKLAARGETGVVLEKPFTEPQLMGAIDQVFRATVGV